jgi:16S rRNA (uracil1498-N3)-methyltransferase
MRRYLSEHKLGKAGSSAKLNPENSHHLLRVNLTPRGTTIVLFDEAGHEAIAELVDVQDDCAILCLQEDATPRMPAPPLVLIQGQPKRPALEQLLRMATELGATEIRIFRGIHSIAKGENLKRWDRVVAGTVAQCGRHDQPTISHSNRLEDALENLPEGDRYVCVPGTTGAPSRPTASVILIGPEGGLHPKELTIAKSLGFTPLNLGQFVLRCDTAVAAALGLTLRASTQDAKAQKT